MLPSIGHGCPVSGLGGVCVCVWGSWLTDLKGRTKGPAPLVLGEEVLLLPPFRRQTLGDR